MSLLLGAISLAAWWSGREPKRHEEEAPAPALPLWREISPAPELAVINAPWLARYAKRHETWQNRENGARRHVLEFSDPEGRGAPALRLVIEMPGAEPLQEQPFFVEIARRAAERGLAVVRAAQPSPLATRFGPFEVAEIGLARRDGAVAACSGFRFANEKPRLRISGFACSELAGPPGRALACLIGRLDLAPAAGDADLVWFFASREPGGGPGCESAPAQPRGKPASRELPPPRANKKGLPGY
ncbi:MAG TPA: hypothetical protein VFG05_08820 [Methylocella sp.]|nr:hypothetical protein [Methylocella sp.]